MRHRLLASMLAISVSACGLTMTHGPDSNRPRDQRPVCTETMDAPKRDAYGAIAGFITLFVGVAFWKAGDNETVGAPLVVGGAVLMAASYASGGVGYYRVKSCRKAIDEFERAQPQPQQ